MGVLTSSRYANSSLGDKYARNRIFVDMVGRDKKVLELGCSTGFLSQHLVMNGCKVTGVEIDTEAAEAARTSCDRVENIDINDPNWINRVGGPFDAILFGDVLEHLLDPVTTLRLSRQLLRNGGEVIISLPNIAHWSIRTKLLLGNFDYQEYGILDVTHLRFFTVKSALALINEAGFAVQDFRPIVGGRFSQYFRGAWQFWGGIFPGILSVQMIFRVVPKAAM
jgi:2-polyprenyl-3-methyl-5-hydroxy-6-metoxy-1,4-benzoquinol methylase